MKNDIAGKQLWEVGIEYVDGISRTGHLWITTDVCSVSKADAKAKAYLKRNRDRYPNATVGSVKYVGTIDA